MPTIMSCISLVGCPGYCPGEGHLSYTGCGRYRKTPPTSFAARPWSTLVAQQRGIWSQRKRGRCFCKKNSNVVQFSQTAILSSDKVVRRSCAMLVWRRCWREYPISDKYLGPPYSRTKIYAARVSYAAADDAHRAPLDGFAAAARAAPGTDRQTDGRMDTVPF